MRHMSKPERLEWLLGFVTDKKCYIFQEAIRQWLETGLPIEQCLGVAPDKGFRPMQADKIRRRNELLVEAARALPPSPRPWVGLTQEIREHNRRWSNLRKLQEPPERDWNSPQEFLFYAHKTDPDKPLPGTASLRRILKSTQTPPIVTVVWPGYAAPIDNKNGATTPMMLNLHERIQLWEQHHRRVVRNPDNTAAVAEADDIRPLFNLADETWQQDTPVAELLRQTGMLIPVERLATSTPWWYQPMTGGQS